MPKITKAGFTWNIRDNTSDSLIIGLMTNPGEYLNFLQPKKSDVILDIGMNVGGFSMMCANEGANVIGYEPHKETCELAKQNFIDNNFEVEVYEMAIGPETKDDVLYLHKDNWSIFYSTILCKEEIPLRANGEAVPIKVAGINDVLEQHRPTKIKMDCEGVEYDIIMAVKDWYDVEKLAIEWHSGKNRNLAVVNKKVVPDDGRYIGAVINKLSEHFSVVEKHPIADNIYNCTR